MLLYASRVFDADTHDDAAPAAGFRYLRAYYYLRFAAIVTI